MVMVWVRQTNMMAIMVRLIAMIGPLWEAREAFNSEQLPSQPDANRTW